MNSDEIYRMKQLMGLSTPKSFVSENYKKEIKSRIIIEALTGGKDELYKWIAKASGLSDETAEAFSKEASSFMKQSDEFAQALAKEGLDDVGKIQQKLSNAGYDISNLDNAITMYFKQNPNVATEILVTIPKFTDNIIRNMSLEQVFSKRPDLIDPIKYLSGPNFKIRNQSVADEYKEMAGELSKLAASDGSESVKKILKLMDVKIESYNATKSLDSGTSATKEISPTTTKEVDPVSPKSNTSDEPTGFKGQKDFEEFKKNWIKDGVTLQNQYAAVNVIKSEGDKVFMNLPTEFDPSKVTLGKTNTYEFFGRNGELRNRTQIEVTLPNGQKTIMYSSSGANEGTTGKKAGEWFWLPGFGEDSWYIKTTDSVAYTKGGNQYMTDFAGYLEKNGYDGLGKDTPNTSSTIKTISPQNVSSNRLTSIIGDTSKIDWSKIANKKGTSDYEKLINYSNLIDTAIETNNYSMISRGGFENYNIPNFRTYIMDLDLKGGDVSSEMLQGNSIYQTNRDIFDLYQQEGGASPAFYDWLKTLPKVEMEDLYRYINSKK
jgi:hypothetical protein